MRKVLLGIVFLIISTNNIYSQVGTLYCRAGFPYCYYTINSGLPIIPPVCSGNAQFYVVIMDSCSFVPWTDDTCLQDFGQIHCSICASPNRFLIFALTDSVQIDSLISLLDTSNHKIPLGNHILVYTCGFCSYSLMPHYIAFKNAFINLGSSMMSTLPDTVPFIFYVKMGFPGTISEVHGNTSVDVINISVQMQCMLTDINEIENSNSSVSIFPNPATNEIRVHPDNYRDKVESVEIYDVMGEKIISLTPGPSPSGEGSSVDVSSLRAGIYFVRVRGEKSFAVGKFVKE